MTQCPPNCGLCCESISLSKAMVEAAFGPKYDERLADPRWTEPTPSHGAAEGYNPRGLSWLYDATFIREHLHFEAIKQIGEDNATFSPTEETYAFTFGCDAFDVSERRCTMYEDRPLMCEGYPFYGRDPSRLAPGHEPINDLTCVFHGDVPPRKLLPLEVLHG